MAANPSVQQGRVTYTLKDAFIDPDFLSLPIEEKIKAAEVIDSDFKQLDPVNKFAVMTEFEKPREVKLPKLFGVLPEAQGLQAATDLASIPANLVKGIPLGYTNTAESINRFGQAGTELIKDIPLPGGITLGDIPIPLLGSNTLNQENQNFKQSGDYWNNLNQALQQNEYTSIPERYNKFNWNSGILGNLATVTKTTGESLPGMAMTAPFTAGGGIVGSTLGKAALGRIIGTTAGMGIQEGGGAFQDYLKQGLDPKKAAAASLVHGIIAGGMENLPFENLLKIAQPGKKTLTKALKDMASQAGSEGVTGGLQQLSQNTAGWLAGSKQPITKDVGQSILGGIGMGGLMGGAGHITKKTNPNYMQNPITTSVKGEIIGLNRIDTPTKEELKSTLATLQQLANKNESAKEATNIEQPQEASNLPFIDNGKGQYIVKTKDGKTPTSLKKAKTLVSGYGLEGKVEQVGEDYILTPKTDEEKVREQTYKLSNETSNGKKVLKTTAATIGKARQDALKQGYNPAQVEWSEEANYWVLNPKRRTPVKSSQVAKDFKRIEDPEGTQQKEIAKAEKERKNKLYDLLADMLSKFRGKKVSKQQAASEYARPSTNNKLRQLEGNLDNTNESVYEKVAQDLDLQHMLGHVSAEDVFNGESEHMYTKVLDALDNEHWKDDYVNQGKQIQEDAISQYYAYAQNESGLNEARNEEDFNKAIGEFYNILGNDVKEGIITQDEFNNLSEKFDNDWSKIFEEITQNIKNEANQKPDNNIQTEKTNTNEPQKETMQETVSNTNSDNVKPNTSESGTKEKVSTTNETKQEKEIPDYLKNADYNQLQGYSNKDLNDILNEFNLDIKGNREAKEQRLYEFLHNEQTQQEPEEHTTTYNDYADEEDLSPLTKELNPGSMVHDPVYSNDNGELKTSQGRNFKLEGQDKVNLKANENTKLFKDIQKAIVEEQEIGIKDYDADEPTIGEKYKKFIPLGFQVTSKFSIKPEGSKSKISVDPKDIIKKNQDGSIEVQKYNKKGEKTGTKVYTNDEIISRPGDISVFGYRAQYDKGVIEAINKEHPEAQGNDIYKMRSYRIDRFKPEISEIGSIPVKLEKGIEVNKKGEASKTGKTIIGNDGSIIPYDKYSNVFHTAKFNWIKQRIMDKANISNEDLNSGKINSDQMKKIQEYIRKNPEDWKELCK